MLVKVTISYLGKAVQMTVDFDDEKLVDESTEFGRQTNMDTIVNHFYDNVQADFEVKK